MRMRRKKRLEERLAACGGRIIYMEREDRNFSIKDDENILDIKELFKNKNPLRLEIGCGKGQFACEIAAREPNVNFIAVEKSANVIVEAAEKAIERKIPNIIFLRGGAEYLDCYIPPRSVELIYLNFSCPYPKNSYASHRLTHRNFLEIYKKLLVSGGEVHQKTDNRSFFEFSLEEFSQNGWMLKNISLDLHSSDFEGNIVTEYEEKFSSRGLPIYRLEAFLNE